MSYEIVCASTADLLPEETKNLVSAMVPLVVTLDGREYEDQVDVSTLEFYDMMASSEGHPSTSQPTPLKFAEAFQNAFDNGADQIICITVAGKLSGTVESARLAAAQFDKPIEVIDSLGATVTEALAVIRAAQLKQQGVPFDQAVESIRKSTEDSMFLVACDTLDALLAGGRLSAEDAANATALNIKPIFTFNEEGALRPFGRARGMKGVVKQYIEAIQERTKAKGKQAIRFCHTGNEKDVSRLKELLQESGIQYVDAGTVPAGITIATHLGLGSLGVGCVTA